MRNFIGLLLMVTLFASCYEENKVEAQPPDKLLSEIVMVQILTDMQLAEGVINYKRLHKLGVARDFKDSVYSTVFEQYDITLDELNQNLDYYNTDPQNMELMYEQVLTNLSKMQTEVQVAASKNDTINEIDDE